MMNTTNLSFSEKLSYTLIILIASSFILYVGQDVIVPLLFSLFFAIILQPIVHFLSKNTNKDCYKKS